jgi:hypothetical protein
MYRHKMYARAGTSKHNARGGAVAQDSQPSRQGRLPKGLDLISGPAQQVRDSLSRRG